MVFNKLNVFKIFLIIILAVLFSVLLIKNQKPIETNLAKSILPKEIVNSTKILQIMDKPSKTIKVVFESEDEDELQKIKQSFIELIDSKTFEVQSYDYTKLLDYYTENPINFLSAETRKLLLQQDYNLVYEQALARLYNPTGVMLVELEKDPYLLLTDYLLSNNINSEKKYFDGKYYDSQILKMNSDEKEINKKLAGLVRLKSELSTKSSKIYLAGVPIHTYYTTLVSTISINLICVLITFFIVFLTYFFFRNLKLLLPIALSICFGLLAGFSISRLLFENFHIITFLFGTTLIGIGIDYSYHYIFSSSKDKEFFKDLNVSLLSTIFAFALLLVLKIEILSQIAVFTIVGLLAIYIFIVLIYPCLNFTAATKFVSIQFGNKTKIIILCSVTTLALVGLLMVKFDDSLAALYKPACNVLKAEILFNKINNQFASKAVAITVKGKNFANILEKEEKITSILDENNITYISISKFIPSEKRQKENHALVKKMYANGLVKYSGILSPMQIEKNIEKKFSYKDFNVDNSFSDLMLDNETFVIMAFSDNLPQFEEKDVEIVNFQKTISDYLEYYRVIFIKILPAIYAIIFLLLFKFYGLKKSVRMFLPILISSVFVLSFISLLGIKLNLFNMLGILLALGFTIDYSIFAQNKTKETETAIFLACITTAASFFLLSFTGFRLISLLALTLWLGIVFNYVLIKVFTVKDEV